MKYYKPQVNWCMSIVEGFTDDQVQRARECWKLLHELGASSYVYLCRTIKMNLIKKNMVIFQDIKLAEKVFRKDVIVLKGKETRPHTALVTKEELLGLTEDVLIKEK